MENNDERLEELEIKLMDLENSLHELNQVVIRQTEDISALRLAHQHLLTQLENSRQSNQPTTESDIEIPPHY